MTYATTVGVIDGVHTKGNGFSLREEFTKRDGTVGNSWITVFPKTSDFIPVDGTTVSVAGSVTASANLKDDGTIRTRLVVNNATIEIRTEPTEEPY